MTKVFKWILASLAVTAQVDTLIKSSEADTQKEQLVTCAERQELAYFESFESEEAEIRVRTPCESCCCSNGTNQVDCSGVDINTIDHLAAAQKYAAMSSMTHIYLNRNALDNLSHFHLLNVTDVISVEIKENKIKTFELDVLHAFPVLKKLDLQSNQINQVKSTNRPVTYLEVLNLAKNNIETIGNKTFEGLVRLKSIDLSENEISLVESAALSRMPKLQKLKMSSNKIRKLEMGTFSGNNQLVELDLASNEIDTLNDGIFKELKNLKTLRLNRNNIAFVGLSAFKGLKNVRTLDLTRNWLAGVHPDMFTDLPTVFKHQIYINENPLMCDCDLRHLVSWISRWPFRVTNAKNLRCSPATGNASKNAGKRLLELQSHDLCDWLVELRDMILVPVVVLVILSLIIILVCVLRGRRKQFDGSMATMSTNYKSAIPDSFSISSSHQGSSDHTQATNITSFTHSRIHLPASLVPATFSPKPAQPPPQPKPVPIAIMEKPKAKLNPTQTTSKSKSKQKKRLYQKKEVIASPISDRSSQHQRSDDEDSYSKSFYSTTDSESASYYSDGGL
jgi:predicted RNA-binding protein